MLDIIYYFAEVLSLLNSSVIQYYSQNHLIRLPVIYFSLYMYLASTYPPELVLQLLPQTRVHIRPLCIVQRKYGLCSI